MMPLTLKYIYHSCFAVVTEGAVIVFDYSRDNAQGELRSLIAERGNRQLYFVVSHFHEDHYNPDILTVEGAKLLVSYDTAKRRHIKGDKATAILRPGDIYSDEHLQLRAMRSTDVGISSLVTLPDGTVIYHAGDNNNWYFSEEGSDNIRCSLQEMEGLFYSIVQEVKRTVPSVDYVMFPVDPRLGKEMLRGVCQWLCQITTKHFYPMHCWERMEYVRESLEPLKELFPSVEFVVPE